MHNRILVILLSLLFLLTACGGSEPAGEADLSALAETLLADAAFTDDLALIDDDTVTMLYGIEDAVEQYVYIGSGATPEEIADWAYFLTVTNGFCTGQNILVDGGESINYHFVWKNE